MISVENLTKRYGSGPPSVDAISFTCAPGSITGFLGPNGAGKSTTLRALCGLTPPTSGSVTINGSRYAALPNPGRVVGVMLDASAQHPGRTGRETMRLAAALLGVPRDRADAMLERVGLQGAERRRVRDYSLGMRQRLGIGQALLGDPSVLVLDEPANGLDPEGIRWMRGLLRDFAAGGGTVLVSSHLLREVEATVDRLVVIDHGRIIAAGTMSDLARQSGGGTVVVRGLDPAGLGAALSAAGLDGACQADGALLVRASAEQVGRAAYAAGQVLTELKAADAAGLEDLFFRLTAQNGANSGATTTAGTALSAREEVPA
jgi:ABC-2 type transport system ATP-binding protein